MIRFAPERTRPQSLRGRRPPHRRTPGPLVVLAMGLGAGLLGCAGIGDWFGPRFDNASACRHYVDTYNHLDCLPEGAALGPDVCPEWLDRSGCDLTEYYACLTQSTVCRDGVPHVASRAECGDTACD